MPGGVRRPPGADDSDLRWSADPVVDAVSVSDSHAVEHALADALADAHCERRADPLEERHPNGVRNCERRKHGQPDPLPNRLGHAHRDILRDATGDAQLDGLSIRHGDAQPNSDPERHPATHALIDAEYHARIVSLGVDDALDHAEPFTLAEYFGHPGCFVVTDCVNRADGLSDPFSHLEPDALSNSFAYVHCNLDTFARGDEVPDR